MGADAEFADGVPRQLFDLCFDAADSREDVVRRTHDQPARGGRQHPPPGADEDRRAELLFNLTQLMADRRLRDVESISGARDALRAGDLGDQAKVTGFKKLSHEQCSSYTR